MPQQQAREPHRTTCRLFARMMGGLAGLAAALLGTGSVSLADPSPSAERSMQTVATDNGRPHNVSPHIVLIVADDLGYGDLGCYGAPDVKTPVLDRLARDGLRFVSAYANGPECSPTRTALLTGRYQHRVGGLECAIGTRNVGRYDDAIRLAEAHDLGLPPEEVSLAARLGQAGYTCGLFGKWHLGYEPKFHPLRHGFNKTFGCLGGNCDYFLHTEDDGWNVLFEDDALITREGHMTDLIADAALAWYESVRQTGQPFFLYLPFTCPHTPIQPPGSETGRLVSREEWNKGTRPQYAAMIEHMDRRIGNVLETLHADGLRRQTIVLFVSDNGGASLARNAPYSGRKGTTYEGGIRVPCIVRWPGQLPEGQVVTDPTITMDLTYSMARIAGADVPQERPFDGIDILARVQQGVPSEARTLFWRGRRGDVTWSAVRDGDLKRIWKRTGDQTESWLFDLAADPAEQHDLSASHPEAAGRLAELMDEWSRQVAPTR